MWHQHLRRKGFVNLPQRNVVERQPMPCQQARGRSDGRHQQTLVEDIDGGHLEIHEPRARQRFRQSIDTLVIGDPDGGSPVRQRRTVTRRQRAPSARSNTGFSLASISIDVSRRGK